MWARTADSASRGRLRAGPTIALCSAVPSDSLPGAPELQTGPSGTLRRRLLVLFAVFSLGPLIVSNVWGYWVSRAFWVETAMRDVRHVVRVEAHRTLEVARQNQNLLASITAGDEELLQHLTTLRSNSDPSVHQEARARLVRKLTTKTSQGPSLESLALLSPDSEVLATSTRPSGATRTEPNRCVADGTEGVQIRGFEYGDADPLLVVTAPVRDASGASVAVLCGRFTFSAHRSFVSAHRDLSLASKLYLLDDHGEVVCGSEEGHQPHGHGEKLEGRPGTPLPQGEAWVRRYRVPHGQEMIAAFEPLHELGWGLVVEVPISEALADIERLKWQAIAVGTLLAIALCIAIFVTARAITGRLERVVAGAQHIAAGALGERIEVDGPREIRALALSFNQMSEALESSHQTMEQQIVERTRELHASREFSERLLDSIDQRVVVVDDSHRVVKVNRAARVRYGDDLVGRTYEEVFPTHSEPCAVLHTVATGVPGATEHLETTGDNQEIVHWAAYPVRSADKPLVIGIGRAVTAEKQVEAQMIHHEKMAAFGLVAAGVAHEIGNPLASIASQLRVAREVPDRATETLEIVDREVQRISRLLRELVDFARRDRDVVLLVSANQVIEDVNRLLSHDPRALSIRFALALAEGLPGVRAREDSLIQVLLNLGINALDAMPDGGTIVFSSALEGEEVVVRVRDSGPGIPKALQGRIFEPFFTTKGQGRGTGLGLFVSGAIVTELGGRLLVESSTAAGTTFAVRLDIHRGPRSEAES